MRFTEQVMKNKQILTFTLTLGLNLLGLGIVSVNAQESLPCYMINESGEMLNLIDLCNEPSRLTPDGKKNPTTSAKKDEDQESSGDTQLIDPQDFTPVSAKPEENGTVKESNPENLEDLDNAIDSEIVDPESYQRNIRRLRTGSQIIK
jgi:hypothetical protein